MSINYSEVIGKYVEGRIDRPLGSVHPKVSTPVYPVNYGYVEGVFAGDGEEQDVYYLGEDKPVSEFRGKIIAVIHRLNDVEDKWVAAKDGHSFSKEEIERAVEFQERFFDSEVIMK